MKHKKAQLRKAADLRAKIKEHCADLDMQDPFYGSSEAQRGKVEEWLQSHADCIQNVIELQLAISSTNLREKITIKLDGKPVSKPIAYWVTRRTVSAQRRSSAGTDNLIDLEIQAWDSLSDRGIAPEATMNSPHGGGNPIITKRRLYFDPEVRDKNVSALKEEVTAIDSALEIANATTEVKGLSKRWSA
jgi:hypothetical protein